MSNGVVTENGTIAISAGARPTITRTGPGRYSFELSGFGTARPLPSINAFSAVAMGLDGGPVESGASLPPCSPATAPTRLGVPIVGLPAAGGAALRGETTPLPEAG